MSDLKRRWFLPTLVLAVCSAFPSWVSAKVHVVYRFDTRPPQEIFVSGFKPRGTDSNLIRHTLAWTEQSAFVATTSNYEVAETFAHTYLSAFPDSEGYIYRIEADDNFYEVIPSLERFLAQERAAGVAPQFRAMETTLEEAIQQFRWQREVVSAAPVPAASIAWAVSYRNSIGADGVYRVQPGLLQEHWLWTGDHNTFANTNPYQVTWPGEATSASCSAAVGAASSPAGMNCTDDLYAAAEGGVEGGDPIHLALLPSCSPPQPEQERQRKKRSDPIPVCYAALRIVNVSNQIRLNAVTYSEVGDGESWRWLTNDEL